VQRDIDFITELGRPFLAHRLRRLAELFVEGYGRWLPDLGVEAPPRTLSTFLLLEREGPLGITEVAARLRLSHPLVIKLVRGLETQGFVEALGDPGDGRRRLVALTVAGHGQAATIARAVRVLDRAYAGLIAEIGVDLVEACSRVEKACLDTSFEERLRRAAETNQQKETTCASPW